MEQAAQGKLLCPANSSSLMLMLRRAYVPQPQIGSGDEAHDTTDDQPPGRPWRGSPTVDCYKNTYGLCIHHGERPHGPSVRFPSSLR